MFVNIFNLIGFRLILVGIPLFLSPYVSCRALLDYKNVFCQAVVLYNVKQIYC